MSVCPLRGKRVAKPNLHHYFQPCLWGQTSECLLWGKRVAKPNLHHHFQPCVWRGRTPVYLLRGDQGAKPNLYTRRLGLGWSPVCPFRISKEPNQTLYSRDQCSGSMTFWCGSKSADPCLWLMDPDISFSAYCFLKVHLHHVSKIKSPKEVRKQEEQGFSYCFSVLRIQIRDPVPFWPLDPGSGIGFFRIPDPKAIFLRA
jgi:hypothetical protein